MISDIFVKLVQKDLNLIQKKTNATTAQRGFKEVQANLVFQCTLEKVN